MITAYNLADALPGALFGMLALWAAASKRHWFMRTAAVGGPLLVALLIPAYEVVIEFGIAVLLTVAGMAVWRRRRASSNADAAPLALPPFRPRLSLQSLMLTVVIVAVVVAVAARAPRIYPDKMYELAVVGVISAAVALTSVWLVCGRAPWWIRFPLAPVLTILLALQMQVLLWTGYVVKHWLLVPPGTLGEYIRLGLRDISASTPQWTVSIGLGMATVCAWLLLMRRARWFDPFDEFAAIAHNPDAKSRPGQLARFAAIALLIAVALFPTALLYRLLTPPPFPAVVVPEPNGFDDLIAAGKMIGEAAGSKLSNWSNLTDAQLQAGLAGHDAAFERMRQGLARPCVNPNVRDWPGAYFEPLFLAAGAKAELASRTGTMDATLAAYGDFLRVAHEASRGTGAHWYSYYASGESWVIESLWACRNQLSAAQCIDLVAKLSDFDANRESWESQTAHQRIFDANRDWESHLPVILADWSGTDLYKDSQGQQRYFRYIIQLRILIIELGLRAYRLEHGRLPATLDELTPEFLPAVPLDPYGDGRLKYRVTGEGHTIYSLGIDRDDDSGRPPANGPDGDFTLEHLFPPPAPTPVAPRTAPTASGAAIAPR